MQMKRNFTSAALAAVALGWVSQAGAAGSPHGVWLDHEGRAAIEISDCAGKLCGKLVWFKDAGNTSKGCGLQIIGDVRPVGAKWDGGWILDPEENSKYDVEITPVGADKLRVMGYAGMKFLSETYTWTRASPDLQRCDKTAARSDPPAAPPGPSAAPPGTDPGIPFTPPGSRPQAGTIPGPGPSTGPGAAPEPPPGLAPQRKVAKKNCTFEVPMVNVKVTVPCDEDD